MGICVELKRATKTQGITDIRQVLAVFGRDDVKRDIAFIRENTELQLQCEKAGMAVKAKEYKTLVANRKMKLPGMIFQCSTFKEHDWVDSNQVSHGIGAWRHQEYCVLNGLFMVDIDHVEDPDAMWKELLEKGLKDWDPLFAFKTPSGHGLKIVMPADVKRGNLASNQTAFATQFGVEVDPKCKDASRLSFVSAADDIYIYDERLVTYENEAFIKKYQDKYADGSSDQDLFDAAEKESAATAAKAAAKTNVEEDLEAWVDSQCERIRQKQELEVIDELEMKTYKGIKVYDLINAYFGGEPPKAGERHDSLLELARDLRHVVDRIPKAVFYYILRLPFVQDLYREGDPVVKTINDALGYKYSAFMPKKMEAAIDSLKTAVATSKVFEVSSDQIQEVFTGFGERIEELFKYYPCLKEACLEYERPSFPAILFATGCLFGTLATRTWWYHYDQPTMMRRLNYEIFIIADPASRKSGIGALYKTILSPIIANDKVYNDDINKYKSRVRQNKTESDKKKDKSDPLVYPESKTRIHGSRTANNIFIEDMVNNVEMVDGEPLHMHLFTFDSELEAAAVASKGGQWIDKSIFELKAFHNEEDNQQYRNVDSVTGPFDVYWNFIYTGTPFSLYRKVTQDNFGSGLSSRLAVIPLCSEKFKMIPFKKSSAKCREAQEVLKMWAFRMDGIEGKLEIEDLVYCTWQWTDNLMTIADKTQDDALAYTIKRISYYGINVSLPFIIMRHWEEFNKDHLLKVDDKDKELCELVMEIQLYAQKVYFGKYTEHYFEERRTDISDKAPQNMHTKTVRMLGKLPKTFTYADVEKDLNIDNAYARVLCSRWIKDGLIERADANKRKRVFSKTPKGSNI